MSLFDCLNSAIDAGLANPARARAAQGEFQELAARLEGAYPRATAEAIAAGMLKEAAARGAKSRRHTVLAQLMTAQRNTALIGRAPDGGLALVDLIESREGGGNAFESVRFIRDAYRRQFMGAFQEALRAFGVDIAGRVRNRARLKDLVRELHGQATGSVEARRMTEAWRGVTGRARELFNAHGGDIGELAGWGLPHAHETGKIRAAGFDAWRAQVAPRLDWSRIEDAATGKPFAAAGRAPADADAARFLRNIYDGIVTRNWDERMPSMAAAGGGLALMNRRADPRVLHFRDADAWLEYNDAFGAADPFRAMIGHLEGMARDVALMRVLGPNPRAGLEHAVQTAQKRLAIDFENRRAALGTDTAALAKLARAQERAENALNSRTARARAMLGSVTGANNVPADNAWATFLAGTRQILTAAQLGGAFLSAPTDLWTLRMAAKSIGMNPGNVWSRQVQLVASSATRETAAQMGYVADTLANAGSTAARYLGEVWSPEITSRITDAVLRVTLLSYWTDTARIAFQMEFSGYLATQAGRAFDALDAPLRRTLETRGITPAEWDALRDPGALFTAPNGAKFLAPLHWLERTSMPRAEAEGLSIRLQALVEQELEVAVPSVSVEARSRLLGETRPGTFGGELLRSGLMYKSFALSLTLNQIRRAAARPTGMDRAIYAAELIAGMTAFGALSVQLKQMASGRDPRPMDSAAFWGAAVFQGGGLGIFGDFMTAEVNRVGGGLAETIGGPVVGAVADVTRAVASNTARAIEGKETLIGRDVANLTRRYTPGTSMWPTRLAMDRLVWDQLQRLLDPKAEQAWAQQEGAREKNYGTETFWERGAAMPERGPDLERAIGR